MPYDKSFEERIRRFFSEKRVRYEAKPMMGGLCFMVNDKMCVGLAKDRLMARIGPDAYAEALKQKGCRPMDFTGRPMKGFVFVEYEGTKSDEDLAKWLEMALAFNPIAPKSAKKRAPKTRASVRPFRKADDDDPVRELGAQFSLGAKSSTWLRDSGIRTRADIERLGSIEVCRRMLMAGHPVVVVVAYALEAGLKGKKWDALSPTRKNEIKKEFYAMKETATTRARS
jgi:TfoX/Sxy family transcriptional regulator of competence genes